MVLKFMELTTNWEQLEYHGKLEFPISGTSQHISKTVVDYKIFSKTEVFGHFGPICMIITN